MSHTHTRPVAPGSRKTKRRREQQKRIAEQRRAQADLRERYQADTTAPEPEPTGLYRP